VVLVGFFSLLSGGSMAMFAIMAFQTPDECVVAGKWEWNSECSDLLSRLVACSLHAQTKRANNDLWRGKLREPHTPHSYQLTFTSIRKSLHKPVARDSFVEPYHTPSISNHFFFSLPLFFFFPLSLFFFGCAISISRANFSYTRFSSALR
jgi:hypothetical protein